MQLPALRAAVDRPFVGAVRELADETARREGMGYLKGMLCFFGVAHLAFGVVGTVFPRWFYQTVPPWPPLHVGQIQIAGVFDLALALLFLVGATDLDRYLPIIIPVGVVAECGHALMRIGHVMAGDDPRDDLPAPAFMLLFGLLLLAVGIARWRQSRAVSAGAP